MKPSPSTVRIPRQRPGHTRQRHKVAGTENGHGPQLSGGFNQPIRKKNAQVKIGSSFPRFGVNIQKNI